MNIKKISNQNFQGIYISNNKLPEIYETANIFIPHSYNFKLYLEKEKRVKEYENTDVFVLKDGTVYVESDGQKLYMDKNKPLFHKYFLALTHAQYIEDMKQKKTV